ncbi:MAG: hypothetical protein LM590_01395 [Thermofilum sp.]|jgi:uncharacterized membrane protein|nr:hypothetical protein [Thermofilum sp.]
MTSIVGLSELMKKYTQEFSDAISRKDYDGAIAMALNVLEKLISIARGEVLGVIVDPTVRSLADNYIAGYEKTLSYTRGVLEGLKYVSPLYAYGEKEQLIQLLASSVSELFSFIMGALIIVASLSPPVREEGLGVV